MFSQFGSWLKGCVAAAALAGLAACGGGGGGASESKPTPGSVVIDGYAPTQAYTITAKDASGTPVASVTPDARGKFSINLTGKTGPFLLIASPSATASMAKAPLGAPRPAAVAAASLFGWVDAFTPPAGGEAKVVVSNVNALTTWAIQSLTQKDNAGLLGLTPGSAGLSANQIAAALRTLVEQHLPDAFREALAAKGIDIETADLLTLTQGDVVSALLAQQQIGLDAAGTLTVKVVADGTERVVPIPSKALKRPVGLALEPAGGTLIAGTTHQLHVRQTYEDGTSETIDPGWLVWKVEGAADFNPKSAVLTVGTQALRIAVSHVTAEAADGTALSAHATFDVTPASLSALAIDGAPASLEPDASVELQAYAIFNNGTVQKGVAAQWSVSDTTVASIDSNGRLVVHRPAADTGFAVTASYTVAGVNRSASVPVLAKRYVNYITAASIDGPASLVSGGTARYQLSVSYRDGSSGVLNADAWSENHALAAIDGEGALSTQRSLSAATVVLSATLTDPATREAFTVPAKTVALLPYEATEISEMAIHGPTVLNDGQTVNYTVTARLDGQTLDISDVVALSSDAPAILSVNGLSATGSNDASRIRHARLTASYRGVVSPAVDVSVGARYPALQALRLDLPPRLQRGERLSLSAIAIWSNGAQSQVGVTEGVNFGVDDGSLADIRNGVLTVTADVQTPVALGITASLTDPHDADNTVGTSATTSIVPAVYLLAGSPGGAGSYDGVGGTARLNSPYGVAVDAAGNVYVADTDNHTIRKIRPDGTATTFAGRAGESGSADGSGAAARFFYPRGIALGADGHLYVTDSSNRTVRRITPEGVVTTLAGTAGENGYVDGQGAAARFGLPVGIAVGPTGSIYVSDYGNHVIRTISPAGVVGTLRGSDAANYPWAVAVDRLGNVYIAEHSIQGIIKVTPDGEVSTLAGGRHSYGNADGTGINATFASPSGIAVDADLNLYVADSGNHAIRKVTPAGEVTTVAGAKDAWNRPIYGAADGVGRAASFSSVQGLALDAAGRLFIADRDNHAIRVMAPDGTVGTLAGRASLAGNVDGAGALARFNRPTGVDVDTAGNVYVTDYFNYVIRKISPGGVVSLLAGNGGNGLEDGVGASAGFRSPEDIVAGPDGNVYVADEQTVRKITPDAVVTTIAGRAYLSGNEDGFGVNARFTALGGLTIDATGTLYIADQGAHTIRKLDPSGQVSTVAGSSSAAGSADGSGSEARFRSPGDVAVDSKGNLYVSDVSNHTVRRISPQGEVTTLAGVAGVRGATDGTGAAARFNYPRKLAIDEDDNLYVADSGNGLIRRVTPAGEVTTLAGVAGNLGVNLDQAPVSIGEVYGLTYRNGKLTLVSNNAVLRLVVR